MVSFDPFSSVLSTLQLMQFNRFDSPCHYRLRLHVYEFTGMVQLVQLWVSIHVELYVMLLFLYCPVDLVKL